MITLEEAIELATKAHEGQWRKKQNATIKEYSIPRKEIVHSGSHYILENDAHLFEDTEDEQVWKIMYPYITHPLEVMAMMSTDEEKIVAVLHDIIEDTEWRLFPFEGLWIQHTKDKQQHRVSLSIYSALHKLTKWKKDNKSYKQHIEDISKDKLATKVKLADIVHNLSCNPSEHAKEKYLKAIPILLKGL